MVTPSLFLATRSPWSGSGVSRVCSSKIQCYASVGPLVCLYQVASSQRAGLRLVQYGARKPVKQSLPTELLLVYLVGEDLPDLCSLWLK